MSAYKQLSEVHAYRLGMLAERVKNLQYQTHVVIMERDALLDQYGLRGQNVLVVTEPGGAWPVGIALDPMTNLPIESDPATESPPSPESSAEPAPLDMVT